MFLGSDFFDFFDFFGGLEKVIKLGQILSRLRELGGENGG